MHTVLQMLKKQLFNKYRLLCCFVDDTLGIVTDIFSLLTCYISIFYDGARGSLPFLKITSCVHFRATKKTRLQVLPMSS